MRASRKSIGLLLVVLGCAFVLNAILGRYIVLPGYLQSLEAGQAGVSQAGQDVGVWKVVRYLLWAYSFKLGVYLIILGAALRTAMALKRFWLLAVGGLVYVGFAYIPLPEAPSIVYGLVGGLITAMLLAIVYRWIGERETLPAPAQDASDLRMIGYFFFAMATYTLCPLMGVKTFALQPERMIEYGLQGEAASFSFHLLIELMLGWFFIWLSTRAVQQAPPAGSAPRTLD